MWIIIIIIVVGCCIAASISEQSDAVANENVRKISAKRPDAIIRLFNEEFPDFSGSLTYSKAEEFCGNWDIAVNAPFYKDQLDFFNQSYKNTDSQLVGEKFILEAVCKPISEELLEYALKDISNTFNTIQRILKSSQTLAAE